MGSWKYVFYERNVGKIRSKSESSGSIGYKLYVVFHTRDASTGVFETSSGAFETSTWGYETSTGGYA